MFNIEQAIAEWRRLLVTGIKTPEVMDELESHLREDVERQMQAGLDAQQAFGVAVDRIGQAASLKHEFAKVGGIRWALLGKLKDLLVWTFVPLPSSRAFTTSARQTLELACTEAPRLHHDFIGTEHVLLALLALEKGVVPNVLKRMRVDRDDLRKQVEKWISIFPSGTMTGKLPYTPRVKRSFRLAAQEAKACNRTGIGPEHLFLGLLLEGDGVAGRVLKNLGLSSESTRKEILRELGHVG